jgi:hypothetical protein
VETVEAATDHIDLQWSANPEADTTGYKVYWDTATDGFIDINQVDIDQATSYTFSDMVPGTQ